VARDILEINTDRPTDDVREVIFLPTCDVSEPDIKRAPSVYESYVTIRRAWASLAVQDGISE